MSRHKLNILAVLVFHGAMLAGIANGFLNYLCSVNDREVVFIDSSLPNINSLKAEWADKEIVVLSEGAPEFDSSWPELGNFRQWPLFISIS
jgi:hypothetical protein